MSVAAGSVRTVLHDEGALISWLLDRVRETPDVYLRVPEGGVRTASRLKEDLGVDSLGRIGVFYMLLDAFGLDEAEQVAAAWITVGDVLAFVRVRAPTGEPTDRPA